jgi:hypothetical protein
MRADVAQIRARLPVPAEDGRVGAGEVSRFWSRLGAVHREDEDEDGSADPGRELPRGVREPRAGAVDGRGGRVASDRGDSFVDRDVTVKGDGDSP